MEQARIAEIIRSGLTELRQALPAGAVEQLAALPGELQRWGARINLTAIRDPGEMIGAHIFDSLSVRPYLEGRRIIDVGTGAGFPGLPLAIAEPEREFTLLDSNNRKISFVKHVAGMLRLRNVTAVRARAEDYAPEARFDTVIARALASTPRLLDLAGHLVREDGVMLAQKGKHPAAELQTITDEAGWKTTVVVVSVPRLASHERHVVLLRRAGTTE